jgi:hypothetical protein
VDYGEVMPNIPQVAVFLTPCEQPLKLRHTVELLPGQRFEKPRRACDTSNDRSRSAIQQTPTSRLC